MIRAGVAVVLGLLTSACSADTSGTLWPEYYTRRALHRPANHTDLPQAQDYARQTLSDFDDVAYNGASAERLATYGLYGMGVAAGANIVTGGASAQLRNLGLAAAALLGLRETVKPDQQQSIFTEAAPKIVCAIDTDESTEATLHSVVDSWLVAFSRVRAEKAGAVQNAEQTAATANASGKEAAERKLSEARVEYQAFQRLDNPRSWLKDPTTVTYALWIIVGYVNIPLPGRDPAIVVAQQNGIQLLLATFAQGTPAERARTLTAAVDSVKAGVAQDLASLTNPDSAFAAFRGQYDKIAKDLEQKSGPATGMQFYAPALVQPSSKNQPSSEQEAAVRFLEMLPALVKPLQDQARSCSTGVA